MGRIRGLNARISYAGEGRVEREGQCTAHIVAGVVCLAVCALGVGLYVC